MRQSWSRSGKCGPLAVKVAGLNAARQVVGLVLLVGCGLRSTFSAEAQLAPAGIYCQVGINSDLAIAGPGYFVLYDPMTGAMGATRFGEFSLDENGNLVNGLGMRVQGFTGPSLTQVGDINISNGLTDVATLTDYTIQSDGTIEGEFADGSRAVAGQILLQNFGAPANLGPYPDNVGVITPAAGALPAPVPPGTAGLGTLLIGELEESIPVVSLSQNEPPTPDGPQGFLTSTSIQTDLAVEGRGYFVVRDTNSGGMFATRAGACYVDGAGYLVNYSGLRMQGIAGPDTNTIGDLQMSAAAYAWLDPDVPMADYSMDMVGNIWANFIDGSMSRIGQILLTDCTHPGQMVRTNFGVFPMSEAAGPWTALTAPGAGGFGWVMSGSLELNQFDESILAVRQRLNFFVPGPIYYATNGTDLAILGNGFFTLRDPDRNIFYATQIGAFHLDAGDWLVDSNGYRVQGFMDASLSPIGDLRIDATGAPAGAGSNIVVLGFTIGSEGCIDVDLSDGTEFIRGQVLLQNYQNLQALVIVPGSDMIYSNVAAAGPMMAAGVPGSLALGTIVSGCLESPFVSAPLQLPPTNGLRLLITGIEGPVSLESSTDLHDWNCLGEPPGSDLGEAEYYDTNSAVCPARFYRVRLK